MPGPLQKPAAVTALVVVVDLSLPVRYVRDQGRAEETSSCGPGGATLTGKGEA
jgi:hypothetical protein